MLVVEDEPRNQALIRAIFAPTDHQLSYAGTVAESRRWLAANDPPDLVLLDLRLADESGLVLARELRAGSTTSSLPILAVTASVLEADRRAAREAGCNDFVEKPISPRDLLAKVRALLDESVENSRGD